MEYQKATEVTGKLISNKTDNAVRSTALAMRANSYDGQILKVIKLVIRLLIELQTSQKRYHKIFQKQVQINMAKKYLKKDTYISRIR